jgi:hypothetical protein
MKLTDFRKKLEYQVSSKSVQWEPICSMGKNGRKDGQTDIKLIVAFRNFVKAPKNTLWTNCYRISNICKYIRILFIIIKVSWITEAGKVFKGTWTHELLKYVDLYRTPVSSASNLEPSSLSNKNINKYA